MAPESESDPRVEAITKALSAYGDERDWAKMRPDEMAELAVAAVDASTPSSSDLREKVAEAIGVALFGVGSPAHNTKEGRELRYRLADAAIAAGAGQDGEEGRAVPCRRVHKQVATGSDPDRWEWVWEPVAAGAGTGRQDV